MNSRVRGYRALQNVITCTKRTLRTILLDTPERAVLIFAVLAQPILPDFRIPS